MQKNAKITKKANLIANNIERWFLTRILRFTVHCSRFNENGNIGKKRENLQICKNQSLRQNTKIKYFQAKYKDYMHEKYKDYI